MLNAAIAIGFIGLVSLRVILLIYSRSEFVRFLRYHQTITDESTLENFKSLARRSMYLSLVRLVCIYLEFLLAFVILFRFGVIASITVIAILYLVFILLKSIGEIEKKVMGMPCADERLNSMRNKICETWLKKALPDF
jgi:hypothetical protein